jgi:hypothetical protein
MIVLIDAPDDGYCESRGWVSVDVPEDDARDALAEFCVDEDDEPGMRPAGVAKRVWLRCVDRRGEEDERWEKCEPGDAVATEFYEFDATDTERRVTS